MKETIKKNIIDSGHTLIGIVTILEDKFLKLKCCKCGDVFIIPIRSSLYCVSCSNCETEFPNKYDNSIVWEHDTRTSWVFTKLYNVHKEKYTQVSEYKGRKEKISFLCNDCGNIFDVIPGNIFKGRGCPKCSGKHRHTSDEFREEIKSIHGNNITLLNEYKNANTKVRCKCNVCNTEWESSPNSLRVRGCPSCSLISRGLNSRYPKEDYIKDLYNVHKDKIIMIGDYQGINGISEFKCNICGYTWKSRARNVLNISKCLNCANEEKRTSMMLDNDTFLERVKNIHGDNISILEEYRGTNNKIKAKCNKCGNVWDARSSGIMYGSGCPKCTRTEKESHVLEYVNSLLHSASSKRFFINGKRMEIDIYCDEYKLGFEFDGLYWHSEIHKSRSYHKNKQSEFKSVGIRTVHIREDEWDNKQEIVKSRIRNILGKTENRIYARKCDIRIVSNEVKDIFLERYHIQGKDKSSVRLGLYYKNKIVSIMTFSKARNTLSSKQDLDENVYELLRFANRTDLNVVGGFSKLLKHGISILKDTYGVIKIKTYADKRWSDGGVYLKNGFKLHHESDPNYIYTRRGVILNRYECQKHKLEKLLEVYDENLSEKENMYENGYYRIFDCGNMVFYLDI